MTTLPDAEEVHVPLETVKVYVPGEIPEMVILVPVPVVVALEVPLLVRVQVPDPGKPVMITFPVTSEQVASVTVPMVGADGDEFIVTAIEVLGVVNPLAE